MKKNKTIAYALAATLLVGGTFAGTKAWFSDKVETDNGIKITMGTLDLDLTENEDENGVTESGWKLVRAPHDDESKTGGTPRNGESGSEFTEIRPGDEFTRTFTVKNTGSLDQFVSVDKTTTGDLDKNLFKLIVTGNELELNEDSTFRLNAGEKKTLTLKLIPDRENIDNTYNRGVNSKANNIFDLNEILGSVEITGRQINAESNELSPEHK